MFFAVFHAYFKTQTIAHQECVLLLTDPTKINKYNKNDNILSCKAEAKIFPHPNFKLFIRILHI